MKQTITKITLCLTMLLMVVASPARVKAFDKFSDRKGFTSVYFSKLMLDLARSNIKTKDMGVNISNLAKKANGLQIISAETRSATKELRTFTHGYATEAKYDILMQVNDDDDKVIFYFKEDEHKSALILMCDEVNEAVVIILEGTFTQDDIAKAMKQ